MTQHESGILAYGGYLPRRQIERQVIGAALGERGGKGTRTVASYDEDSTTLAVEAARVALRGLPDDVAPASLVFATTSPAYLDKTNATTVHAALGLPRAVGAFDAAGSVRSAAGALRTALGAAEPTLVVAGDVRTGLPGSADERDGGDAGAALVVGPGTEQTPVLARLRGHATVTEEFLDRWRVPGESRSQVWEERFGEHAYVPLAEEAFAAALKSAGCEPGDLGRLAVTGVSTRAVGRAARATGVEREVLADDLAATVGNSGAAHPGLVLGSLLDVAEPGQLIGLLVLADGAEAFVFEATEALGQRRAALSLQDQLAASQPTLDYMTFLTWRGQVRREPPRRPDPERPAAPPSFRNEPWKFSLAGSRCNRCGTAHLPPARVCIECGAVDEMTSERFADRPAKIATYTVDRLAFSLSPPVLAAVLDFEGGGRLRCEITEADPDELAIGDEVEMTFRRLYTAGGVHNYFWKARPSARKES